MPDKLVILGASTRAAAFSAIRAGIRPICGDMFADADLRQVASILEVPDFPRKLRLATQSVPPLPWIYTGALENSPSQIHAVSQRHQLLGNGATVLRSCRDPWNIQRVVEQAGLPTLELRTSEHAPPHDGNWIIKPYRSAAGRNMARWEDQACAPQEAHYFQRFQSGCPISAAFLGLSPQPEQSSAELLGVSTQLIGSPRLNAPHFGYCGSIVPSQIDDLIEISLPLLNHKPIRPRPAEQSLTQLLIQAGQAIARECHLRGLFGIDFIWDGNQAWILEVNPRYTASMELVECALDRPLLDWHRRACLDTPSHDLVQTIRAEIRESHLIAARHREFFGKVVLYADRNSIAPDLSEFLNAEIKLGCMPQVADIPINVSAILQCQPVLTCLGRNDDPTQLHSNLIERAHTLWNRFA